MATAKKPINDKTNNKETKTVGELTVPNALNAKTPVNVAERKAAVGLGSQNVTKNDVLIPRLKLLQPMSPEISKAKPEYIEGAQPGMLLNTATGELHTGLFAVNLHFERHLAVWRKRPIGGLFGTFDNEAEARAALAEAQAQESDYDFSENPTHLVMLLNDEGVPRGVALIDMPSSKVKVSKKWNTKIAELESDGHPRFGCVWAIGVTEEANAQGTFFNFKMEFVTVAPAEIYDAAQAAYNNFFGQPKVDENGEIVAA